MRKTHNSSGLFAVQQGRVTLICSPTAAFVDGDLVAVKKHDSTLLLGRRFDVSKKRERDIRRKYSITGAAELAFVIVTPAPHFGAKPTVHPILKGEVAAYGVVIEERRPVNHGDEKLARSCDTIGEAPAAGVGFNEMEDRLAVREALDKVAA